jgi:hypothetical protein
MTANIMPLSFYKGGHVLEHLRETLEFFFHSGKIRILGQLNDVIDNAQDINKEILRKEHR